MIADTIFALSSGRPPAAVAVIRVSGPAALDAARAMAGPLPPPRRAALRTLRDTRGEPLDRALVIAFPGPETATGEDVAELHLHGGRAVVRAVEAALGERPGLRPAVAGEFTRRAVENGRLDLTQAEGLADLLEAETEDARRAALTAAEGAVGRLIDGWFDRLISISARVEGILDFADEADVQAGAGEDAVRRAAAALAAEMTEVLDRPPVERLHDGVRVVLAGPPNAGKSTLLNLLCGREAAIASAVPGTTRDVVEVPVRRGNRAYLLQDTAGLGDTEDPVEAVGIVRARAAATAADLVLWLGDDPPPFDALWLHARADDRRARPGATLLAVSRSSPASVEALWCLVDDAAARLLPSSDAVVLSARQRRHAGEARDALRVAEADLLILAEQLRVARSALHSASGVDVAEAVLDELFARFCIGK